MHKTPLIHFKIHPLPSVLGLSLLLSACGGGGTNPVSTPTPTPPATYTVSGTVTGLTDTLQLHNNGGDALTLGVGTVGFTFNTALASGAAYAVTMPTQALDQRCAISNSSGTITTASISNVNILCTPKVWGAAALIEADDVGDAYAARIAVDASGNALAVWSQDDGTRYNIYANRYTPGSGWGIATLIETDNAGDADNPQIAFDASGNALAVWRQRDSTRANLWANRYTLGSGWGTATLIETDNAGDAYNPQLAFDASGNALAVWRQYDGTRVNLWANRYTLGSGWGTATLIEASTESIDENFNMALDANGNALALWHQGDGTRRNLWANRYTVGSGWGTATLIENDNAGDAYDPRIAFDASGNALAVWHQYDGTRYNIWANRYTVGSGWGIATLIETDNAGYALSPRIAVDASGNALAVWQQYDGTRNSIYANRYTPGSGWGAATLIETDNTGDAETPQIAFDAHGNALAIWEHEENAGRNLWANHYTPSSGWGTATLIENDDTGSAYSPQLILDTSGKALVVWQQDDGTRTNIWANRYTVNGGWGIAALIETDNAGDAYDPQVAVDANGNALAVWYQYDGTRYNIYSSRYE